MNKKNKQKNKNYKKEENIKKKKRICLINPTIIIRRPIKEIIPFLLEREYDIGFFSPYNKKKSHLFLEKFIFYLNKTLKNKILINDIEEKKIKEILKNYKIINNKKIILNKKNYFKIHLFNVFDFDFEFEWPIPLLSFFKETIRVLKEYDIFLLWTNFYIHNLLFILLSLFYPRKKIILIMDTIPGYSLKSNKIIDFLLRIYNKTFSKIIFLRSKSIILYCDSLKSYAKKAGLPMKKVRVIPTALNKLKNYELPRKKESKIFFEKKYNINLKNKKIISFIGLLNNRKGVFTLIETIKLLSKKRDDFLLLIAGTGPKEKIMKHLVKKYGLEKKIIFLGFIKEVEKLLSITDIFFFPSKGEGLAGVIMEAMYQKKAILTTKIPCTDYLIKNNKEGILVPLKENIEEEFLKKLLLLLNNPLLRKKLGMNAHKKILFFDWNERIKEYEKEF